MLISGRFPPNARCPGMLRCARNSYLASKATFKSPLYGDRYGVRMAMEGWPLGEGWPLWVPMRRVDGSLGLRVFDLLSLSHMLEKRLEWQGHASCWGGLSYHHIVWALLCGGMWWCIELLSLSELHVQAGVSPMCRGLLPSPQDMLPP